MKKASDDQCVEAYERFGHLGQAAASIGIHKSTLHGRLVRLGVSTAKNRKWSPEEDGLLCAQYAEYRKAERVDELAKAIDRTFGAVAQRAHTLGLTDVNARQDVAEMAAAEAYGRSIEERYRAGELLLSLGAQDHTVRILVLDGDPMSKARMRFTRRGGAYTPASVVEAEKRWVNALDGVERFEGNVAVACVFVRASAQRIDVDNMTKLVLDACTAAGVWYDDSQVTGLAAVEEFDPHDPRTVLALAPHESTMIRGQAHWPICPTCDKQFNPASRKRPVFCSAACRANRPTPAAA